MAIGLPFGLKGDPLSTDNYAPDFQVLVNGRELDPESKGDVLDLKVSMDIDNLTSFDLTINNWDDRTWSFKYSDSKALDVGTPVVVRLGYAGRLVPMVRGVVTAMAPRFVESGPPTIAVSGQDSMVRLRDRKPGEGDKARYENLPDWRIAQLVAQRNNLRAVVTEEGPLRPLIEQKNRDDALFLMERARSIDFECYVQTDPASGGDALHFVRPNDARSGRRTELSLVWGRDLINFSPQLTVARQVSSVTVRGWDPETKSEILETARPEDIPRGDGEGGNGPQAAAAVFPGKQDVVVDRPVSSREEARALALAMLRERAAEYITGNGQIIGTPALRPGMNLRLDGLGRRFSGLYYVKKVDHMLSDSGYQTSFEVRRFHDGGTRS